MNSSSTSDDSPPTDSPCTGVCRLNTRQICIGCGRTAGEIAEWSRANTARRQFIRQAARARKPRRQGMP